MPPPPRGAVAVAASAGGVEALQHFVSALPADFPLPVLVVLHIPPTGPSVLPQILTRAGNLPARHPVDTEELQPGVVLVAPPDRHLLVEEGHVTAVRGPRESGHRPSGDTLLRSVATSFGIRAAGVVLSGTMDDGAAGLLAIRTHGGLTLVQAPEDASFPGMPLAAIAQADPDVVGTVPELVTAIRKWADELADEPEDAGYVPEERHELVEAAMGNNASSESPRSSAIDDLAGGDPTSGEIVPFTCPECGGTLWRRDEHGAERYRCRVGHSFSPASLLVGKQDALEAALWAAIVALEERLEIIRRVLARAEQQGASRQADRYRQRAEETEQNVRMLGDAIAQLGDGALEVNEEVPDGSAS